LKAEMEAIQQQMIKAKKNEHATVMREVKRFYKEFDFTVGILQTHLLKVERRLEIYVTR